MSPDNRQLFGHLALALARYSNEVRREGIAPPADLLAMAEFFADCARVRQGAPSLADVGASGDGEAMTKHPLLTNREAAAELRISARSLDRLVKAEKLKRVLVEGSPRIRRSDLDAYVTSLAPRSFRDEIEEKTA